MYATNGFFKKEKKCWWSRVELAIPDLIWGVQENYMKDMNPIKINLGVGAYRDDNGKPYILQSVIKAEERIFHKNMNKEYSPISGDSTYCKRAASIVLGEDCNKIKSGVTCTVQTISGAGALRVGFAFLSQFHENKNVYVSSPTWNCHVSMIIQSGLMPNFYRYYNTRTFNLDFQGLMEDLNQVSPGSIILLQVCGHNPTGIDPTLEQWSELSKVMKQKQLFPFFDMAYQGFVSGDIYKDNQAIRIFLKDDHQMIIAQSFAKNMGIYGERAGTLTFVTGSCDEANRILSQLNIIIRSMYSNPPIHGARIVNEILGDPELKAQWLSELRGISNRLKMMRQILYNQLIKEGSVKSWSHIVKQNGMFCYTGLDEKQCERLKNEFSVHMTNDGRICVAGINTKNVQYLAKAIHQVTKQNKNATD